MERALFLRAFGAVYKAADENNEYVAKGTPEHRQLTKILQIGNKAKHMGFLDADQMKREHQRIKEEAEARMAMERAQMEAMGITVDARNPLPGGKDRLLPGDWHCVECGDHQFATNTECEGCGVPIPPDVVRVRNWDGSPFILKDQQEQLRARSRSMGRSCHRTKSAAPRPRPW